MPHIGNHVDAIFLPESVNTSTTLKINGGDLNVNNGQFFVDQSTTNVGIGTVTPSTLLDIYGDGVNTTQISLRQWNTGNDGPDIRFFCSGGTIASPVEPNTGDILGKVNAFVNTGSSYDQFGGFGWTYRTQGFGLNINRGSSFAIETKSIYETTNSAKIYISEEGNVGIGTASPFRTFQINGSYNSSTSEYGAPNQWFINSLSSASAGTNLGSIVFSRSTGSTGASAKIQATATGTANETDLYFYNRTSGGADNVNNYLNTTPTLKLYHDKTAEFASDVNLPDDAKLLLGTDDDFQIYYDGGTAHIDNNQGQIRMRAASAFLFYYEGNSGVEDYAKFLQNGAVELYHNNVKAFETTSTGINVPLGTITGPATLNIDPAVVGDNTGTVVIKGDLQVDGTTTTINSTTLTVDDKNIVLASGAANSAAADGAGITIDGANASLTWVDSNESFKFSTRLTIGSATSASANLRLSKDVGGENTTTYYSFLNNGLVQPDVTGTAYYNFVQVRTDGNNGTGYTISKLEGYSASVGSGTIHADTTITNLIGFEVKNTWTAGTNNYGFRGEIATGTNRWNVYMDGTAPNYFAGSVGIGTDDPGERLDVRGKIRIEDDSPSPGLLIRDTDASGDIEIYQYNSGDLQILNNATSRNIIFQTHNGTSVGEKLRITSDGRVGIGTDSPATKLEIAGTGSPAIRIKDLDGTSQFGQIVSNNGLLIIESRNENSDGQIVFRGRDNTDTNEYGRFDEVGRFGVGVQNLNSNLHVKGGSESTDNLLLTLQSNGVANDGSLSTGLRLINSTSNTSVHGADIRAIRTSSTTADLTFSLYNGSTPQEERLRITAAGEVLINESVARSYVDGAGNTQTPKLQVESDDNTSTAIALRYNSGGGASNRRSSFIFARTADGTAVADDSVLGEVLFMGEGNNTLEKAASIRAEVDGTPGTNDMPGRLIFSTSADGSDSPTERLRIASDGNVQLKTANAQLEWQAASGGDNPFIRSIGTDQEALEFNTGGSSRVRIGSGGSVGIGTDSPEALLDVNGGNLVVQNSSGNSITLRTHVGNGNDSHFNFQKSRGGLGTIADVQTGDHIGTISFSGYFGGAYNTESTITVEVDLGNPLNPTYSDRMFYDSNEHRFRTNGSTRIAISAAGSVGINTTAPSARLHVRGTQNAGGILVEDSSTSTQAPAIEVIGKRQDGNVHHSFSGKLLLAKNRTDAKIQGSDSILGTVAFGGNHSTGSTDNILYAAAIHGVAENSFDANDDMPTGITFRTGSTGRSGDTNNVHITNERLRITSSGRIGIGTNNPIGTLHVSSGTSGDATLILEADTDNSNDADNPYIVFRQDGGVNASAIGHGVDSGVDGNVLTIANSISDGSITFATGATNGYANATEKIRITPSGQVGVGVSTVARGPLHIHQGTTGDTQIHMTNSETGTSSSDGFTIFQGAGSSGEDCGFVNREENGRIRFVMNSGVDMLGDPVIEDRMILTSGGFLGIKTTPTKTLDVNGLAYFRSRVGIGTTDHSGYQISVKNAASTISGMFMDCNSWSTNSSKYGINLDIDSTNRTNLTTNRTHRGISTDMRIRVAQNASNTSGTRQSAYGMYSSVQVEDTDNNDGKMYYVWGSYSKGRVDGINCANLRGAYNLAQCADNATGQGRTVDSAYGTYSNMVNDGNQTTITNAYGVYANVNQDDIGGAMTNAYGVYSKLDRDAGTGGTGHLFRGDFDGTWSTKRGLWLTGDTENSVNGTFSAASKDFKIPHPLPELSETKNLVHTCIEAPAHDLIYRGKSELVDGFATINLDTKFRMTEGTFVALNRKIQCFTSNESDWSAVRGSVSGNILTIECQDSSSTATVSWMVIGERQDDKVKSIVTTDADGNLILEPDREPEEPDTEKAETPD